MYVFLGSVQFLFFPEELLSRRCAHRSWVQEADPILHRATIHRYRKTGNPRRFFLKKYGTFLKILLAKNDLV